MQNKRERKYILDYYRKPFGCVLDKLVYVRSLFKFLPTVTLFTNNTCVYVIGMLNF